MKLDIFHLQARSAFHFGVRGVGIEASADHASSDTLFSALCNTLRLAESNAVLESVLQAFRERRPPFLCSGAFPYVRLQEDYLRFYPAPATLRRVGDKTVRKVVWLSESLFYDWTAAKLGAKDLETRAKLIPDNGALVTERELKALHTLYQGPDGRVRLWTMSEVPRVTVDRVTNASSVYQAGQLRFVPGGGLWCAFAGLGTAGWDTKRIAALLTHLGHFGLGGERSSGYGQFDVHPQVTTRTVPDARDYFITLSNCYPQESERALLEDEAAYDLILRRGWMSSPGGSDLRRKSVRMIRAGSVLRVPGTPAPYGDLVDVTPDVFRANGGHNVWCYGYALPLGIKL